MTYLSTMPLAPGAAPVTDATVAQAFGLHALGARILWTHRTLPDLVQWRNTWAGYGYLRVDDGVDIEVHRARPVPGMGEVDIQIHDFGCVRGVLIELRSVDRDFIEQFAS